MRRQFRTGFGRVTAPQLTAATKAGDFVQANASALDRVSERFTEAAGFPPWIIAEITGNTAIANTTHRWEYDFQQVQIDQTLSPTSGFWTSTNSEKALNLCELVNDGLLYEGPGWNMVFAPTGYEVRPISNCVVQLFPFRLTNGTFRWVFFAANVLDGECPENAP